MVEFLCWVCLGVGLQLLGRTIDDPEGTDGIAGSEAGLGLLDIHTHMEPTKVLRENQGVHITTGLAVRGYEIHVGQTTGSDADRPFAQLSTGPDGACSQDGAVCGTYLHGLFA